VVCSVSCAGESLSCRTNKDIAHLDFIFAGKTNLAGLPLHGDFKIRGIEKGGYDIGDSAGGIL